MYVLIIRMRGKGYAKKNKKTKPKSTFALVKNEIKSILNKDREIKWFALGLVYGPTYAGYDTWTHLTAVPQSAGASTDSSRIGDQIEIKSIHIKMSMFNNVGNIGSAANFNNFIRVICVQYNESDGSPTTAEMLLNGGGTALKGSYSHFNVDYRHDYHVLYDKTIMLVGNVPIAAATNPVVPANYSHFLQFNIPLKRAKKQVRFLGGGTNSNDGIWMIVLGGAGTTTNNPQYQFDSMLRFTDS